MHFLLKKQILFVSCLLFLFQDLALAGFCSKEAKGSSSCKDNDSLGGLKEIGQKITDMMSFNKQTEVTAYETSFDGGMRSVDSKLKNAFDNQEILSSAATIDIDPEQQFQIMEGFGGSLTESCSMSMLKMNGKERADFLKTMFSKDGMGLDVIRLPVGGSDFSDSKEGSYSYNDTANNKPDPEFKNFNLSRDEKSIKIIKEAKKINPRLKVMITPWSAPAWMKKSKVLHGGSLDPKHYQDYANYLVKVIAEYKKRGIPVGSLTFQNEPRYSTESYPSMEMNTEEQMLFLKKYLGPTLEKEKSDVKVYINDHNWGLNKEVKKMLDDDDVKKHVGGVAYHCYGSGNYTDMSETINSHPDKPTFQSECTGMLNGNAKGDFNWWMEKQAIGPVNIGTTGAMGWNLCLDEKGGPRNGGCKGCRGLATVTGTKHGAKATYNPELVALSHVSRFIEPGSRRIDLKSTSSKVRSSAFINEDGKVSVVLNNTTGKDMDVNVRGPNCKSLVYKVPAQGAVTLNWQSAYRKK